jgi:predicted nucleic-acid-binding protein
VIAHDTNVLVRFLVRDDEAQHRRAVALVRKGVSAGEDFFVGDVVLAEVAWVLQGRYGVDRAGIVAVLHGLLEAEHMVFESADRCLRALRRSQSGRGGFADYLIAERAADARCDVVATFDRALLKEDGFRAP